MHLIVSGAAAEIATDTVEDDSSGAATKIQTATVEDDSKHRRLL